MAWDQKQIEFLKAHVPEYSYEPIAKAMRKSVSSVARMASKLGLTTPRGETKPIEVRDGFCYVPLHGEDAGGLCAVVDAEDEAMVAGHRWSVVRKTGGKLYARTSRKGKDVFMHDLVTGKPPKCRVRHLDGDTLNNRSANLVVSGPGTSQASSV